MGAGGVDLKKLYETERENIEILNHNFALADVERKLIEQWRNERTSRVS
jgi:hypothetical protein